MSELLEKIRSRGHWRVRIRPIQFEDGRISDAAELEHILDRTFVQLRGWDFPHLGSNPLEHCEDAKGNVWVGRETDWEDYVEFWRFYRSGQFIHYSGMKEDWPDQRQISAFYQGLEPGEALDAFEAIIRFSEILEFAARLVFRPADLERINLEVTVNGLEGRALWDKPGGLFPANKYRAKVEKYHYQQSFSFIQLADSKPPALEAAQDLFGHFGWNPSMNLLRDIQTELLRKGSRLAR